MDTPNTVIEKRKDGWHAKTLITLGPAPAQEHMAHRGPGERVLSISTYKNSRGLGSYASVAHHYDGCVSFAIGGDYSKHLIQTQERCTEKAIRAQHAQALALAQQILDEAHAYYAAKDAQKVPA